jgi:hypothetical protein
MQYLCKTFQLPHYIAMNPNQIEQNEFAVSHYYRPAKDKQNISIQRVFSTVIALGTSWKPSSMCFHSLVLNSTKQKQRYNDRQ